MMAGCYSINALKLLESVLSLSRQHVNCDDCWNVKGKIFRPFLSSSVQPVSKCCETETKLTFRFVFAAFMTSASVLVPTLVFAYFLLIVEHLVVVTSAFSCQDYRNEIANLFLCNVLVLQSCTVSVSLLTSCKRLKRVCYNLLYACFVRCAVTAHLLHCAFLNNDIITTLRATVSYCLLYFNIAYAVVSVFSYEESMCEYT